MSLSINGNDIQFDGTVRVVNGFNPDTGVAYLILTPTGGTGAIPFLAQGLPGQPPIFDSITVVEVDPAVSLPSPNPVVATVSAGGAGVASHLTLTFYIHKGNTGAAGANTISTATDLAASPVLGVATDKYTLIYNNSTGKWVPTAQKVGDLYVPGSITSKAFNNTTPHLLCSIAIPAQPFDWRPKVYGQAIVTGSSDTRVDLVARLNDAAAGDQVGYSYGLAGAAPPPNILASGSPTGSAVPGVYGKVTAGNSATIYIRAEQKAASSNSWSISNTNATFAAEVQPLL